MKIFSRARARCFIYSTCRLLCQTLNWFRIFIPWFSHDSLLGQNFKDNGDLLIPVKLACCGWQIKQTEQTWQAPQSMSSILPKTLRGHWSREASNPWQFITVNQVVFVLWIECGHFLLRKLSFKGGPRCSWRHITSANRYVHCGDNMQITPHVPLYLTSK